MRHPTTCLPGEGGGTTAPHLTSAERALIRQLSGFMQPVQLLRVLNERRQCDMGDGAALVTMDLLRQESIRGSAETGAQGWAELRRCVSEARRSGLLASIRRSTLEDFAVVFGLTSAQVLQLKDVLSGPLDEAHGIGERS